MRRISIPGLAVAVGAAAGALLFLAASTTLGAPDIDLPWSVGASGGNASSSTNFNAGSTAGQPLIGPGTSAGYRLDAGYWAREAQDPDGDRVPPSVDPCPLDPDCDDDSLTLNATQTGGLCDTGGAPLPRFRDCIELFVGTNAVDPCADTATANDEPVDKMPADFNDDRKVNVTDRTLMVLAIKNYNNDPQNNYNRRFDLNAGGTINVTDRTIVVLYLKQTANAACMP